MTYCHTDISHFEIQQFQQISGCLAERSKAPDSRNILTAVNCGNTQVS